MLIVMDATTFDATETDRIAIDVPEGLTAAESKLVYVFLAASDGATVEELDAALDMGKISLFPRRRETQLTPPPGVGGRVTTDE